MGLFAPALKAQPVGPETLAEGFAHAWNAHDAKAFADLFSPDADWITVSGVRVKGRAEIQSALGKEHATWARTRAMNAMDIEARSIRPDLALVFFKWEIVGSVDLTARPATVFRGNTVMVAEKQIGRWIVVAGQAARASATR